VTSSIVTLSDESSISSIHLLHVGALGEAKAVGENLYRINRREEPKAVQGELFPKYVENEKKTRHVFFFQKSLGSC
jgi:hypothetical protein